MKQEFNQRKRVDLSHWHPGRWEFKRDLEVDRSLRDLLAIHQPTNLTGICEDNKWIDRSTLRVLRSERRRYRWRYAILVGKLFVGACKRRLKILYDTTLGKWLVAAKRKIVHVAKAEQEQRSVEKQGEPTEGKS